MSAYSKIERIAEDTHYLSGGSVEDIKTIILKGMELLRDSQEIESMWLVGNYLRLEKQDSYYIFGLYLVEDQKPKIWVIHCYKVGNYLTVK